MLPVNNTSVINANLLHGAAFARAHQSVQKASQKKATMKKTRSK
jgi:hypothetical protein